MGGPETPNRTTLWPLVGNASWTQPANTLHVLTAEVTAATSATCGGTEASMDLSLDGKKVAEMWTTKPGTFHVGFLGNTGLNTALDQTFVILDSPSSIGHQLVAKVGDACSTGDWDVQQLTGGPARVQISGRLQAEVLGDHHPLHLVRPLTDLQDLLIPVEP